MKRPVTPFGQADQLERFVAAGLAAQTRIDGMLDAVATAEPRPVDLVVYGLTLAQAYALAELCKRIGWSDARKLAIDDAETHLMIAATSKLGRALADEGVSVR